MFFAYEQGFDFGVILPLLSGIWVVGQSAEDSFFEGPPY
jgi:hypothetical protein